MTLDEEIAYGQRLADLREKVNSEVEFLNKYDMKNLDEAAFLNFVYSDNVENLQNYNYLGKMEKVLKEKVATDDQICVIAEALGVEPDDVTAHLYTSLSSLRNIITEAQTPVLDYADRAELPKRLKTLALIKQL